MNEVNWPLCPWFQFQRQVAYAREFKMHCRLALFIGGLSLLICQSHCVKESVKLADFLRTKSGDAASVIGTEPSKPEQAESSGPALDGLGTVEPAEYEPASPGSTSFTMAHSESRLDDPHPNPPNGNAETVADDPAHYDDPNGDMDEDEGFIPSEPRWHTAQMNFAIEDGAGVSTGRRNLHKDKNLANLEATALSHAELIKTKAATAHSANIDTAVKARHAKAHAPQTNHTDMAKTLRDQHERRQNILLEKAKLREEGKAAKEPEENAATNTDPFTVKLKQKAEQRKQFLREQKRQQEEAEKNAAEEAKKAKEAAEREEEEKFQRKQRMMEEEAERREAAKREAVEKAKQETRAKLLGGKRINPKLVRTAGGGGHQQGKAPGKVDVAKNMTPEQRKDLGFD